jgi:aminoglycoside phosphotransferase (APT) family kinase protein
MVTGAVSRAPARNRVHGDMKIEDVTAILCEHFDEELEAVTVSRAALGNAQETWFVEARGRRNEPRELVLRRSAAAGTLEWTDRAQEYSVLRALAQHGLPVPEAFGHGTLDRPYVLMERRAGTAPGRLSDEERGALARDLGRWLARLHRLEPRGLGLEAPTTAREATLDELRRWQDRYRAARPAPVPLLGALLAWAERNVPVDDGTRPVLLWGDPGPHNVLMVDGRINALLDWELSHVGHPLEDLGAAVWSCFEQVEPNDVVAGYEAEAGVVDHATLEYFVALACATRSVMVLNGVRAWLDGRASAPSTAALGLDLLAFNLARGARAAGWGDLPPADGTQPELPLRPDAAESVAGVARWLIADLLPAEGDRRLRRMLKVAAALLEATANRVSPVPPSRDPAAAEEEAVRAELAGGDPALRAKLLADLAREWARLEPLTTLHGNRFPARVEGRPRS